MTPYSHLFFSILLHIFLLFVFLSVFFWFIISKIENKNINDEIFNMIKNNLSEVHIPKSILTDDIYNYLQKYFSGKNITVETNNKLLLKFNICVIVLLFCIILL